MVRQHNTILVQPRVLQHATMRKQILLSTALMASVTAMAQTPLHEPDTRWSIQAMGAGAMSYRTLVNKDGSEQSDAIIELRDGIEDFRVGYGGHVMLTRPLCTGWTVGIGLSYMRFGYESNFDVSDLSFGDMIDPRRGFIYGGTTTPPVSIRHADEYQYIGIPVRLERTWGGKRFHPLLGLCITPAYLLDASTIARYEYADGSSERHSTSVRSEFQAFNLFATLEAGCAYDASDRLQIRLIPYANLGVLEIVDAPISARLWSAGVQAGAAWRF